MEFTFAFALIGTGTYPLATFAFAFAFAFTFAFGPIETPQCVNMLFHFVVEFAYSVYMKSFFSKNTLIANPKKIEVVMAMSSFEIIFWERALHKFVHIYAFIHM